MPFHNNAPLNVLIVDDEQNACKNLGKLLSGFRNPTLRINGFAYNTKDAERLLSNIATDALFLDIEMPNENAFQFLDRIAPFDFEVVFVTAYSEFAVKAFKLNALDYILKPLSVVEVHNAVRKLQEKIQLKRSFNDLKYEFKELQEQLNNNKQPDKIVLKENREIEIVAFENICFVEAQGSYSKIFFLKKGTLKTMLMSNYIAEYETLFPAQHFFRIHKSYLINVNYIQKIFKDENFYVVVPGEHILPVSRRRYSALLDFLKKL
jgi:two-component system, LytTR family, response regulator